MEKPKMEYVEIRITSPDCMTGEGMLEREEHKVFDAPFFLQAMMNRVGVSFHKYGTLYDMFPELKTGIQNAVQRMQKYEEDGNLEWLVDAANYLMIEFLAPSHEKAHFRATDSDESPGSVLKDGGIDHGKAARALGNTNGGNI